MIEVKHISKAFGQTNAVHLFYHSADDWRPAWSPDGTRLTFNSERDGDYEIFIMGVDGENIMQVTLQRFP